MRRRFLDMDDSDDDSYKYEPQPYYIRDAHQRPADPIWYIRDLNFRESMHVIIPVVVAACFTAYGVSYQMPPFREIHELECRPDTTSHNPSGQTCYHQCENGTFTLPNLEGCIPYLTCDDMSTITIGKPLGSGAVKKVYRARWNEFDVVVSKLAHPDYQADFIHGRNMLSGLQRHPRVVQLLGWCGDDTIITEYHSYGSAQNVEMLLGRKEQLNNLTTRFLLCLDYAQTLAYLHSGPLGVRVMCDSNDVHKTLSQYLITDEFRLVVNDLDALPEVTVGSGIKCGRRELSGDLVAPEQRWPYEGRKFSDAEMPTYSEKIDVWKIPDICLGFIGSERGSDVLKYHLHKIHTNCKAENPRHRPSAGEIFLEYERVKKYITLHSYKET